MTLFGRADADGFVGGLRRLGFIGRWAGASVMSKLSDFHGGSGVWKSGIIFKPHHLTNIGALTITPSPPT